MYCIHCGNPLKDDDRFCPKCGKEVAVGVATQMKETSSTEYTQERGNNPNSNFQYQERVQMGQPDLSGEKVIVDKAAANLFRGIEGVGGRLTITNKRVIFNSHALNLQAGTTEILISDIASVSKRNTLGIVPNGMSITLKNGTVYKFVIGKRDMLIKTILDCIGNLS